MWVQTRLVRVGSVVLAPAVARDNRVGEATLNTRSDNSFGWLGPRTRADAPSRRSSLLERLVNRLRDSLVCSDPLQPADVIFVLAGRRDRKAYGVELLRQGWARELLLSTLSAHSLDLSRFAALNLPAWSRLLKLQGRIPPAGRLFFLGYDGASWRAECLPVRPLGTLNEIAQLARWLRQRPDVGSVLIVSSGGHLRRIRMCCRALLPRSVKFLLAQVPPGTVSRSTVESTRRREEGDRLIAEYAKLFLYRIVLAVLPSLRDAP